MSSFQDPLCSGPCHCALIAIRRKQLSTERLLTLPTNNRSERNARREAEIRKGARTNKTDSGADRRSVIVTVLASLQTRLAKFTLSNMLAEVGRWMDTGKCLFGLELEDLQAKRAPAI